MSEEKPREFDEAMFEDNPYTNANWKEAWRQGAEWGRVYGANQERAHRKALSEALDKIQNVTSGTSFADWELRLIAKEALAEHGLTGD